MTVLALLWLAAPGWAAGVSPSTAPFALPPPSSTQAVHFESDRFEYDRDKSLMHLTGHVSVYDSTWTIHSKELWLNTDTRAGRALGPLDVEDALSRLDGSAGEFNFVTREGTVEGCESEYAPWRVKGREAHVNAKREIDYRSAVFTSCNRGALLGDEAPWPHYHFRATSLHVKPKSYLSAWNARFYLGHVPVFYFPYLWKSLEPEPMLRSRLSFGHDTRSGYFMRSTTMYNPGRNWQGKLFLDYYDLLGWGVGNQLQYSKGADAHGTFYVYHIDDRRTQTGRWTFQGDHFQAIRSTLTFQARVQAQSDTTFNNDYTRSSAFPVTQNLQNSGALNWTPHGYTTRLSYSRVDIEDVNRPTHFIKKTEALPRVDFVTPTLKPLGLPGLHTFSAYAERAYTRGEPVQQKTAGGGWQVTQTFKAARWLTLTPVGGLSETYTQHITPDVTDAPVQTLQDAFIGRFNLGANARFRSLLGDTDVTEAYLRRLKPYSAATDAGAPDYGIESNLISLTQGYRPNPRIYTRFTTGYDLRNRRGQSIDPKDRVQPIGADLTMILTHTWTLAAHEEFKLDGGNDSTFVQLDWDRLDGRYVRLGVANVAPTLPLAPNAQADQENHYYISQQVGWKPPGATWDITAILRSDVYSYGGFNLGKLYAFDRELILMKDFHDFHTMFALRSRPGGVREFQFRASLRIEPADVWRRQKGTDYVGEPR